MDDMISVAAYAASLSLEPHAQGLLVVYFRGTYLYPPTVVRGLAYWAYCWAPEASGGMCEDTAAVTALLNACRRRPPSLRCGKFAGIGHAQLCFVVPVATGAPRQVIEITTSPFPGPLS